MRNFIQSVVNVPVTYLILTVIAVSFLAASASQGFWVYPLARQVVRLKMDYSTQDMRVEETEHFIIKYTEPDGQAADMVAAAAEAAYEPVNQILNYRPDQKTLILVHRDKNTMKNAYGWSGDTSALGFYWGGVIQVLSPLDWVKDNSNSVNSEFIKQGPMAHEYAHLVLDYLTGGNYSRWFTEGLAQYVEYSVNSYEWITGDNNLKQKWYSMSELDQNFDRLPNQALAYRQSLALIRYIIETYGEESFHEILADMKTGAKVDKAIINVLNLNLFELESKTKIWVGENMN